MNIPNDLPQHKVIKHFNSAIAPLIFHVYILKLNTSNFVTTWTVQIAQSLTFLPCKHKDLSPIPRTQVQKKKKRKVGQVVIPVLESVRQEETWCSLDSDPLA